MASVLRMEGVSKRYGSLQVTDNLALELEEGEALGMIGPNGAGKSTIFRLITGAVQPDAGRIFFEGNEISTIAPHHRCRRGIGRTHQIPHPFARMTVFENLLVGAAFGGQQATSASYDECARILEQCGLLAKANDPAGSLTLLNRKRLELARALATQPKVLLLDEIAGGLTEHECTELVTIIRDIHAKGTSIIWIEHIVHALVAVVGRLIVIDAGRKLAEGLPMEVMEHPDVQQVYMGISAE